MSGREVEERRKKEKKVTTKGREGKAGVNSLSRDALISRARTFRSPPWEVAAEMVRTTS